METLTESTKILLSELLEKFHVFDFLVDHTKNKLRVELELSLKAGEIVGKLYDALTPVAIEKKICLLLKINSPTSKFSPLLVAPATF